QISFDKKSQIENHVLMLGDAAGMITPLCGNGMSMAFHAAKIAFGNIHLFLQEKISRKEIEKRDPWTFILKIVAGKIIVSQAKLEHTNHIDYPANKEGSTLLRFLF